MLECVLSAYSSVPVTVGVLRERATYGGVRNIEACSGCPSWVLACCVCGVCVCVLCVCAMCACYVHKNDIIQKLTLSLCTNCGLTLAMTIMYVAQQIRVMSDVTSESEYI